MATEAQVAANRENAKKSTGPTTPEGKAASSGNSRTHGLSGSTLAFVATGDDAALFERRKADWRSCFRPQGPDEEVQFERVVAESIRVERCRDLYFALCREHGHRARLSWDADRRREADGLALRLGKAPQAVARQLEATRQGAEVKIEAWRGLVASLEAHQTWTDAQRSLALDLLGVRPELRDAATPVDPPSGDPHAARLALASGEIARLEALRDGPLADLDVGERQMAETTLGAELTKPLQLLHRYETAALRRMKEAWRALDKARDSREAQAPPTPSHRQEPPASRPAPSPTPPARVPTPAPAPAPALVPVAATPARPRASAVDRLTTAALVHPPALLGLNRHQRRAEAARARQMAG